MKHIKISLAGLLLFLAAAAFILFCPQAIPAENHSASSGRQAIEPAGSDFLPAKPDAPKTEMSPSSTGMGETTDILIHFMILWSIIYIVIKFVRMWLDKHK